MRLRAIDQFQKSQNAPVPYPTMLLSEQKRAYFCSEWSIAGYDSSAFLDLWIVLIFAWIIENITLCNVFDNYTFKMRSHLPVTHGLVFYQGRAAHVVQTI